VEEKTTRKLPCRALLKGKRKKEKGKRKKEKGKRKKEQEERARKITSKSSTSCTSKSAGKMSLPWGSGVPKLEAQVELGDEWDFFDLEPSARSMDTTVPNLRK
jgi:hypothetical protein